MCMQTAHTHTQIYTNCPKFPFPFTYSYRFRHRQTIAVCPVVQIVFGSNMLMNYHQNYEMDLMLQEIL